MMSPSNTPHILEQQIELAPGQQERALVVSADLVLVASCSTPGAWHRVSRGACDCKGYQHRSSCRHLAVALEAKIGQRPDAQATPHCRKCGRTASKLFAGQCGRCIGNLD